MNVDAERCINLYPEVSDGGTPKVKTWLVGTPGLKGFINYAGNQGGPVRALWQMNGRAFAVVGSGFFEIFPWGAGKRWGTMAVDSNPASICSNGTAGNQIFVVSAGHGYIFRIDTNSFAEITDPNFPAPCAMGTFVDGYFVGLRAQSRQFRISNLEDGTTWTGLDVAETSTAADDLRAMISSHRELWLFGEQSAHVWYNAGGTSSYYQGESFPFAPISGVYIEHGILAPWSVVNLDNTLFWLGSNKLGNGVVWRANGYTPQRVSNHGVEYFLGQYKRLDRAIAYAYQEEGHSFYVLYVPEDGITETTTWVYDVSTGMWHERATWDEDQLIWRPHEGRCHCYAFGRHLIGSRTSGQIYHQSLEYYDEDMTLLASTIAVGTGAAVAEPDLVVPEIARACWFGYFYSASTRYGYNTDGIPQNCLYVEDDLSVDYAVANSLPFVVTPAAAAHAEASAASVIAIYIEGGSAQAVVDAAAAFELIRPVGLIGKPILGVCDGFMPTGALAGVDWLGVECYTRTAETAAQCQARVEAALAVLDPGTVIMLVGLSYTSNLTNTQDATQLEWSQIIPATIATADSRVTMILMFSDGRPTGTQDHEEWRPIHQEIYDGITTTPAILP
jgi:hypothetical protein